MAYKKRYEEQYKQYYYENCVDSLYFGMSFAETMNTGVETIEERKAIWGQAYEDLANCEAFAG